MHLQENTVFGHTEQGHMKRRLYPSTLCDLCSSKALKWLRLAVKERMHLQENAVFDLLIKTLESMSNVAQ